MGAVDTNDLRSTGDAGSVVGRKVVTDAAVVESTSAAPRRLAEALAGHLRGLP